MPVFVPQDPDFEERVCASFARQRFMATLGARLVRVEPGLCEIELDYREDLTQQHVPGSPLFCFAVSDASGSPTYSCSSPKEQSRAGARRSRLKAKTPARGRRRSSPGLLRAGYFFFGSVNFGGELGLWCGEWCGS
jgi:hypothetical protein